jgi:hypothetical protein
MKKKVLAAIVIVVVLALVIPISYMFYTVYSWGADGELTLTISLDKTSMDIDGSINVTYTLKNTGDTDLRVLWGLTIYPIEVYDSNGSRARWTGPVYERGPPPTNEDLIVLSSGSSKSRNLRISENYLELHQNDTYRVVGYFYGGSESSITLPHWTGRIQSNEVFFDIV